MVPFKPMLVHATCLGDQLLPMLASLQGVFADDQLSAIIHFSIICTAVATVKWQICRVLHI